MESVPQEAVPLEISVGELKGAEVGVGCIWCVRGVHNERSQGTVVASEECGGSEIQEGREA